MKLRGLGGHGSKGHGPERCSALPRALRDPACRPRPSVQSPEEEVTRGANGRRRKSAQKEWVPQPIMAGSNPAWAVSELRKVPVARLESEARRLVSGRSQMRKGRVGQEEKAR